MPRPARLPLNLPMVRLFVKLLKVPPPLLYGGVVAFVMLGAYALTFSLFSMLLLVAIGLIGFYLQENGFPLTPAILAAVLMPAGVALDLLTVPHKAGECLLIRLFASVIAMAALAASYLPLLRRHPVPLGAGAVVLGWLYERTRSLIPCIALHAAYNACVTWLDMQEVPADAAPETIARLKVDL